MFSDATQLATKLATMLIVGTRIAVDAVSATVAFARKASNLATCLLQPAFARKPSSE